MTIEDVIAFYGNLNRACLALGITPQNMTIWKRQGYVPLKQQFRLYLLTDGKLTPDIVDPATIAKGKRSDLLSR